MIPTDAIAVNPRLLTFLLCIPIIRHPVAMPLSFPFAVVLLTAPADAPANTYGVPSSALQSAAVALEILDPRETKYVLNQTDNPNAFASDLGIMRRRYAELKDAPPLCDAARFPTREQCRAMLHHCDAYVAWLNQRRELFPTEEWTAEALAECMALRRVWDTADDAACAIYHVDVRRRALLRLRDLVGARAYYAGCLPPAVPVWRFNRID